MADPFSEFDTTSIVDVVDATSAGMPVSNLLSISPAPEGTKGSVIGLITVTDLLGSGSQHFFLGKETAKLLFEALTEIVDGD